MTTIGPTNGTGPGTTTVTRFDNRARPDTTGSATASIAQQGLVYLFAIRPELEALKNEQRNSLEGRFSDAYRALDNLTGTDIPEPGAPGSNPALRVIKGFRLGETWDEFLAGAPHLHGEAARCGARQRPAPQKRRKAISFEPCGSLWLMADDPRSRMTMDCLEANMGATADMPCQDFNGEIGFDGGVLVSLKVVIPEPLEAVLPDIVEKFDKANGESPDRSVDIWNSADLHLIAADFDGYTVVGWFSAGRFQELSADAKQQADASSSKMGNNLD